MRRVLGIGAVLASAGTLAVLGTGAGGEDGDGYRVRAEFRNAFSVIPGLDVKVSGVKVGKVDEVDVSPRKTAIVVLRIDEPGFQDFRRDATCTIRPQSLIGERFVECTPTQPRAEGTPAAPPLPVIREGAGEGQRALGLDRTMKVVDLDLLNNTLRLPFRQRLSLVLNELGTGLASRGQDLDAAVRAASPALRETDEVLAILADQNRVLRKLAVDGDEVLGPLAARRADVAGFLDDAGRTAEATAERREDLERTLRRLPVLLRELRPTMARLGELSGQAAPVFRDLGAQAPAISRVVRALGPFSTASTPALERLGDASEVGRDALVRAKPIVEDLRTFGAEGRPLLQDVRALLTSVKDTGGVERLMDYLFYQVAAINGYDSFGHYLRAILVVNLCSVYATANDVACTANFLKEEGATASAATARAAKAGSRDVLLERTRRVLAGASAKEAIAAVPAREDAAKARAAAPGASTAAPRRTGAVPAATATGSSGTASAEPLLDYLLGDAK